VADPEGDDGDASPAGIQQFLPVKNNARLLQSEPIFDSKYIKAFRDSLRPARKVGVHSAAQTP